MNTTKHLKKRLRQWSVEEEKIQEEIKEIITSVPYSDAQQKADYERDDHGFSALLLLDAVDQSGERRNVRCGGKKQKK